MQAASSSHALGYWSLGFGHSLVIEHWSLVIPSMILDSHQHFWKYDEKQYPWIPKNSPLHRDWLPPDWVKEASKVGGEGSIAVQARQSVEESRWLLELADEYPTIQGVVGWVDLCSERLSEQLTEFSGHPKFVGGRHVVQD